MAERCEKLSLLSDILKTRASLKKLSKSTGIESSRLSDIAGGAEPTLRELRLIAAALEVTAYGPCTVSQRQEHGGRIIPFGQPPTRCGRVAAY